MLWPKEDLKKAYLQKLFPKKIPYFFMSGPLYLSSVSRVMLCLKETYQKICEHKIIEQYDTKFK